MKYFFLILIISCTQRTSDKELVFKNIKANYKSSESVLLDYKGRPIHTLRRNFEQRSLSWVSLDYISPQLVKALVSIEDHRFFDHSGVDFRALVGSIYHRIKGSPLRGASTITMQLAGLLDENLNPPGRKTLTQKWQQMLRAWELERNWSKDQILEAYLNLVPFRSEFVGINAVSKAYFDKAPLALNKTESLILASLIKSPEMKLKNLKSRSCYFGTRIWENKLSCLGITETIRKHFEGIPQIHRDRQLAPHVAYQLLNNKKARVVKSSLSLPLQKYIQKSINKHVPNLLNENLNDVAVVVVENESGKVRGYVGSSGKFSTAPFVDGVKALRQAGSTFKPFIYGLGIENKLFTAASLLKDEPLNFDAQRGIYHPQNYDNSFRGIVTVRESLASSLNIPAIKALKLVGVGKLLDLFQQMHFTVPRNDQHYGLALSLGSLDTSLWDLVNAYRMLANRGKWSPLSLKENTKRPEFKQVLSPESSFIISHILADPVARHHTFGTRSLLKRSFPASVKTGTSKDMRDNWCIGYTPFYTVGVWAGNFSGESMYQVNGLTGAGPIWAEVMDYLHQNLSVPEAQRPAGLVSKAISLNGGRSMVKEYFLPGTEPEQNIIEQAPNRTLAKITYPLNGMFMALDPDIPKGNERVVFQASTSDHSYQWQLNNDPPVSFQFTKAWKPIPGEHQLTLLNEQGVRVDQVVFNVR